MMFFKPLVKDWTVLAYVVGDDKSGAGDLDAAIASELKAICDAADFQRVSVAVQADFRHQGKTVRATLTDKLPEDDNPLARKIAFRVQHPMFTFAENVFNGIGKGLRRMFLKLTFQNDANAASEGVLQDFLQFGRLKCPARRYLIYFFGHAYGPMGLFFDTATKSRPPNSLRLNQLAAAIGNDGGRASIVLFRDCFMSTLETAFQLRTCADFLIASQAEAPIDGVWPWDQFMASLTPNGSSAEIGNQIAETLTEFLAKDGNRGPFADVPYALLDLSVAPGLLKPLTELVRELERARADHQRRRQCAEVLESARVGTTETPLTPGDPALIDVATICEKLQTLRADPVADAARGLAAVLPGLVRFSFTLLGRQKGVALYYKPTTKDDMKASVLEAEDAEDAKLDHDQYRKLALCQQSEWGAFALDPLSNS